METKLVSCPQIVSDPPHLSFSKPKKYTNYMLSKLKNKNGEPIIVQFPKMKLLSEFGKSIQMEFISEYGYTKKVKNFLNKLDEIMIDSIASRSNDWFGKSIPLDNVKTMYKCNEICTSKFVYNDGQILNKRGETIDSSEILTDDTLECIAQLKYLVFTRDSCFLQWELCTIKLHRKSSRVPNFGFIEDPNDQSDDEIEENVTFF